MIGQRTAPVRRVTEHHKARVRLPLFTLIALLGPLLSGIRSTSVWIVYVIFVILYSLWALRLSRYFLERPSARLPLVPHRHRYPAAAARLEFRGRAAGTPGLGVRGWACLHVRSRSIPGQEPRDDGRRDAGHTGSISQGLAGQRQALRRAQCGNTPGARGADPPAGLHGDRGTVRAGGAPHRPVRGNRSLLRRGDLRAGLSAAVSRRGLRLLGPDAQHFSLQGGRVAFVFATEPHALQGHARYESGVAWSRSLRRGEPGHDARAARPASTWSTGIEWSAWSDGPRLRPTA